ncbi:MAG: cytidine deaminase [Odoribacter sp.]
MDKREVKIDYFVYQNSFAVGYEKLCKKAMQASAKSYSIYSNFAVGAAVLLENGKIVSGNNQENAAYPSGLCAERTALFYAGATYPEVAVKALAIVACDQGIPCDNFVSPCGACRQVFAEIVKRYGRDFDVIMCGKQETVVVKASALLPFVFDLN